MSERAPCACGCGEYPKRPDSRFAPNHHKRGHVNAAEVPPPPPQLCACGCGEYTASARTRWVRNHDKRRPKPPPVPCACGCGEIASGKTDRGRSGLYVSGHNSRVAHPMQGKHHTDEAKAVIAAAARAQMARQFPDHVSKGEHAGSHGSWHWMMSRCFDPWNASYPHYGGRGITVCERWLKFENFLADMGDRPEGLTLERVNNNGNYEPANCRWATVLEQNQNRRNPWITRRERYGPNGRSDKAKVRANECGHPERPHYSKGMCKSCYRRGYRQAKKAAVAS